MTDAELRAYAARAEAWLLNGDQFDGDRWAALQVVRAWVAEHPGKRPRDKEKRREQDRKRREKNREKIREYMRAWREKNREKCCEYTARYTAKNPGNEARRMREKRLGQNTADVIQAIASLKEQLNGIPETGCP